MPKELVDEIDSIAGPRHRSEFIEEAVRLKLLNERQRRAVAAFKGLKGDYPYWRSPEDVVRWVRESRDLDNKRLEEILSRVSE